MNPPKYPTKYIVLIVDDQPLNIRMLAEALGEDCQVKAATNGRTALKICQMPDKPDLILLDVLMPEMDGHEVCRRLKNDTATKDIPIIFITAKNETRDEEYGFKIGAVDYIAKPFSPVIVQARVRTHLILKRNIDLLESLAFIDGLTGIPNRRRFDQVLEDEWRRSLRGRTPLSLLIADVDYFKKYNDHYGHGAGDECLRRIAGAIASSVQRPGDFVARYGGEEFVIVLPASDQRGVCRVAERIRIGMKSMGMPHSHSLVADHVTITLGGYTMIPAVGTSPGSLVERADKLLYQAKQSGRDRLLHGNDAWNDQCGGMTHGE